MKKWILILLLVLSLCIPAAASEVTSLQSNSVLESDGSCRVSVSISLLLDSSPDALVYPLPLTAEEVLLNGAPAQTEKREHTLAVLLPAAAPGSYSFTLSYRLPKLVHKAQQEPGYVLKLPILSGFAYPIEAMQFSVTLPEDFAAEPAFYSGYHQENIGRYMTVSVDGKQLSAVLTQGLKDRETLELTMEADPEMFPLLNQKKPWLDAWDIAVLALVALAAVYYMIWLLPVVPRRVRCYTAPDGISAGEVGTCLTGSGPELTLMVITWAQLGYLQMEMNGNHVRLHKRMEMGNERSAFEMRIFQTLFKDRNTVSDSSVQYARLCRKVAIKSPLLHQLFKPSSGNPRIFRCMVALAGAISGVQLGLAVPAQQGMQTAFAVLFGVLCGCFSWFIQAGGKCLPLRDKTPLLLSLGCCGLWIALGVLVGEAVLAVPMVLVQFISGLGAAYGGRRSERGKRCMAELLSLRQYMTAAPADEVQRMLQGNPNYFYELAPYALAMGVDKAFARRFGKEALPDQSFLIVGKNREMTAVELAAQLRRAANILNTLQRKLPYQQLTGRR